MANQILNSLDTLPVVSENETPKITILEELKYFIPPLQPEEWQQLQANILAEGCRQALLVWKTNNQVIDEFTTQPLRELTILIDGHNRYEICLKHGLVFSLQFVHFDSLQMAKNYMIEQQLGRRNLNPEQMAYLRGLHYNQDKLSKGKYNRKKHSSHNDHYEYSPSPKTIHKVADLFGVSPKTIQRDAEFAQGLDKLSLALRQEVLSGKVHIPKKEIQKLAKQPINHMVSSYEELMRLNPSPEKRKTAERVTEKSVLLTNPLSDAVRKCVPNALDFDLTMQIKGRFLIENHLTEIWKELRGFEQSMEIDESFTDTISIYQAPLLGLI